MKDDNYQTKTLQPHEFALCVPIAPKTAAEARGLAEQAQAANPDYVEWRRDAMAPEEDVQALLLAIKLSLCETTGLIYTYRAGAEGGLSGTEDAARQVAVLDAVNTGKFDYVDTEFNQDKAFLAQVFDAAQAHQTGIILSHHRFDDDIAPRALADKLEAMADLPADVIKVALTATSQAAVRQYGAVVSRFSETCDKPVIFTLMGKTGAVVRALPEVFGGTLTFAAIDAAHATAPGQLTAQTIAQLRKTLGFA